MPSHFDISDLDDDLGLRDLTLDFNAEAHLVTEQAGEVQSSLEVAMILETAGYTQQTAQKHGVSDIFELAKEVFHAIPDLQPTARPETETQTQGSPSQEKNRHTNQQGQKHKTGTDTDRETAESSDLFLPLSRRTIFGQTALSSLPWILAVIFSTILPASIWRTGENAQFPTATADFALFLGLGVSGFFTQACGRRGGFYLEQDNISFFLWTLKWALTTGLIVSAIILFLSTFFLSQIGLESAPLLEYLLYGTGFAVLQLALVPLTLTRQFTKALITVTGGSVAALFLHEIAQIAGTSAKVSAVFGQVGGMVVLSAFALGFTYRHISQCAQEENRDENKEKLGTPRIWAVLLSSFPYALYGSGGFLLIMTSRLLSQGLLRGTGENSTAPTSNAQLILLLLFPFLIFVTGEGEYICACFTQEQKQRSLRELDAYRAGVWRTYRSGLLRIEGVALASFLLLPPLFSAIFSFDDFRLLFAIQAGQCITAIAIFHSLTLLYLRRPFLASGGLIAGFVVELIVGATLQNYSPEISAALALGAGAFIFTLCTIPPARRAFLQPDTALCRSV